MIKLSQIRFEQTTSTYLRMLKGWTSITPNLLCRIGFCLSVEDQSPLNVDAFPPDSDRIIDRHVLLGPYDLFFVTLMKQRLYQDGLDPHNEDLLAKHFRAHVHRGVHLLFKRIKRVDDLSHLLPRQLN